ncbi:hypothetical protein [Nakamurella leprariae]|uniref:Nuclear transport factor 2 family protein n=1 Tax=Nakamurella leprariae TaxID=2803911 RepID=A0A939BUP2_9ACTN|nr:hypothetical protein [Nakamurella leprariae]MBM9465728.1 hypothetical protein [Nakamurella leprariae]
MSRLTVVLATVVAVIAVAGAATAWTLGHRPLTAAVAPWEPSVPDGSGTVELTDPAAGAADHPRSAEIQAVLQDYFDGINQQDWSRWASAVAPGQRAAQQAEWWTERYSTTADSAIRIVDVQERPLRARVWFASQQHPAYAPADLPVACISWDLTYLFADQDGRLVINGIDPTNQQMTECP